MLESNASECARKKPLTGEKRSDGGGGGGDHTSRKRRPEIWLRNLSTSESDRLAQLGGKEAGRESEVNNDWPDAKVCPSRRKPVWV